MPKRFNKEFKLGAVRLVVEEKTAISLYKEKIVIKEEKKPKLFTLFKSSERTKSRSVLDEKNLNLLLKWVVEGHLEEVEKLLESNPNLVLMEGNVKDLSGRVFKEITALQYAYWALDAEMMEVIIKSMDKVEVLYQLKSFESNPGKYSAYDVQYDNSVLVDSMKEYLNNYRKWSEDECGSYWRKEVGGAQRMGPAWLVYTMCEEGEDVLWTKKDVNRKVVRQYDKGHLKWWFDKEYKGGKLGQTWAVSRGSLSCSDAYDVREGVDVILYCMHDCGVYDSVGKKAIKVIDDLKTKLAMNNTTGLYM